MMYELPWPDGDGNITLSYDGEGNATVSVSSDRNEGLDRTRVLHVVTGFDDVSADVTVTQQGMREPYEDPDGDIYVCADGEIYGAIKQEIL